MAPLVDGRCICMQLDVPGGLNLLCKLVFRALQLDVAANSTQGTLKGHQARHMNWISFTILWKPHLLMTSFHFRRSQVERKCFINLRCLISSEFLQLVSVPNHYFNGPYPGRFSQSLRHHKFIKQDHLIWSGKRVVNDWSVETAEPIHHLGKCQRLFDEFTFRELWPPCEVHSPLPSCFSLRRQAQAPLLDKIDNPNYSA